MTDIVTRLRDLAVIYPHSLVTDAADEIERLRGLLRDLDANYDLHPKAQAAITAALAGAADQPAAAPRDPDAELREFAGFLTAYLPELHAFEVPRMLDAIAAFRAADNAAAQPDAVSTNSVEVSSELVVPFYYRLQDKRDPYRHMNFDPSAWNFILVPTTPGEGVAGYSAADNSPASQEE